jgi:dipeptidyl aminopeptidase/acylaminoacyl peptidase
MPIYSPFNAIYAATFAAAALLCQNACAAQSTEGALSLRDVPAVNADELASMQPYLNTRSATTFDWLPHGDGLLIGTRFGNTQQLHTVRAPMGARTQLTFAQEPILSAISNHNTQKPAVIYSKDQGGNEQFQLYGYNLLTRTTTLLTEGGDTRNTEAIFAADGLHFAYSRTDASGGYQIRMGDLSTPGTTKVIYGATNLAGKSAASFGTWYPMAFSPDHQKIVLQNYRSVLDSNLVELTIATGKTLALTAAKGVAAGSARYAPDGAAVFFLNDIGQKYRRVQRYEFKTKITSVVGPFRWCDVEEFDLNADASQIALNFNYDGTSQLQVFSLAAGTKPEPIAQASAEPSQMANIRYHPTENRIAMSLNSAQSPGDSYVLDVASGALSRWTEHELGGLANADMVIPQKIQFTGGAGVTLYSIQGYIYRPQGLRAAQQKRAPVLVMLHGGPEAQSRPTFSPLVQYLVRELDIAVITPNVRGSTGYGREFTAMDDGVKRVDAVKDVSALLDFIAADTELDSTRVALMGGSYGGFLTLAGLVAYSDRLKAGVSIVGVSDFSTFLQNTSNYRRELRRVEYGDERKPQIKAFFDRISPLKNAAKINVPLFVIQGANDPRVPASEAAQIADAVRKNNQPVWMMQANDEGHGFKKKANIDRMNIAIAAFLREHLLTPAPNAAAAGQ